MVVEVLVAQGDGDDPLSEQGPLGVHDQGGEAAVGDDAIEGVEQSEPLAELSQQEGAGVGGELAALEVGDNRLGAESGKGEGVAVTVCHSDGLALGRWRTVLLQSLQGVRPSRNEFIQSSNEISGLILTEWATHAGYGAAFRPPRPS